jgi:hypothetical protein
MNAKQNRRKAAKPAAKHVNHFRPSEVAFPSPRKDTIRWVQDFGAVLVDYPLSGVCLGRMGDDQQSREQFLPDLRITSACNHFFEEFDCTHSSNNSLHLTLLSENAQ